MTYAGHPALHPDDIDRARQISTPPRAAAMAVIDEWCTETGFTLAQIRGRGRRARLAEARQALMWVLSKRLGLSASEIGRVLNRDHTTVLHGIAREAQRRETPPG